MKKSSYIRAISFAILFSILSGCSVFASTILPCNTDAPSDGNIFMGVEGSYIAMQQTGLDRINAIRYEACAEGVRNPSNPEKNLTLDDYVPLKWSAVLEKHARLRAAEASVVTGHTRPNGKASYTASPLGSAPAAENLAWSSTSENIYGTFTPDINRLIDLWYGEKSTWVNKQSGVTGHYTSMIMPTYRSVGLGYFFSLEQSLQETLAGEFSAREDRDTSFIGGMNDIVQTIEINPSVFVKWDIATNKWQTVWRDDGDFYDSCELETTVITEGDNVPLHLRAKTDLSAEDSNYCIPLGTTSWSSSDPSVAAIGSDGVLHALKGGTTVVTASCEYGSASVTLQVRDKVTIKSTPAVRKAKVSKRRVTIKVKALTAKKAKKLKVKGIEIQVASDPEFVHIQKIKKIKYNKSSWTFKGKKKATYYIRIRYYSGQKYGKWSKTMKVKVRK